MGISKAVKIAIALATIFYVVWMWFQPLPKFGIYDGVELRVKIMDTVSSLIIIGFIIYYGLKK